MILILKNLMVVTIAQQNIYIIIIHLMKLGYIKFVFMELQQLKVEKVVLYVENIILKLMKLYIMD